MGISATHIGLTIITVVCWIALSLRVYIRYSISKTIDLGDWLIIASCIGFTAVVALVWIMMSLGAEEQLTSLTLENLRLLRVMLYAGTILYSFVIVILKLSIAALLLRFTGQGVPRKIVIWTTVLHTVFGLAWMFLYAFPCKPVATYYDLSVEGECIARRTFVGIVYAQAVASILSDAVYAILPMWIVWQLQLNVRTKMSIGAVLGLGLTTAAVNIARFFFIGDVQSLSDFANQIYGIGITSVLELGIGIFAASMATLRPLLRGISKMLSIQSTIKSTSALSSQQSHTSRPPNKLPIYPEELADDNLDEDPEAHNAHCSISEKTDSEKQADNTSAV